MAFTVLVGAILALIAGMLIGIGGRKADRSRRNRFEKRADLSIAEAWEGFCKSNGVPFKAAQEALELIENATGIPRAKLIPGDRFSEELAPAKGWEFDDGLLELGWALEAKGMSSTDVTTVGDFVRKLATSAPEDEP